MNSVPPVIGSQRTVFAAGRDLKVGAHYRCVANGQGEVVDSDEYLLTTNVNDKKGNRQMVKCSTGEVLFATPSSIWTI